METPEQMEKRHRQEKQDLMKNCNHPKSMITVYIDSSYCGRGSLYPHIVITCKKCNKRRTLMGITPSWYGKKREVFKPFGPIDIPDWAKESSGHFREHTNVYEEPTIDEYFEDGWITRYEGVWNDRKKTKRRVEVR